MPWNRKKLYWWAGGPITARFSNSRKSLYLGQISSNFFKISQHASPRHAPCPGTEKNYIGGPGAPSPPVSGIRGKACISAKSRRILEKFHSMHPLGMLHALEQKKLKWWARGPHHHPFPEFAEKLVSRPNLVEFLKNFTACIPWACSVQLNEKN